MKSQIFYCLLCLCLLGQMIQAQTPPPPPCGTAPVCTWTLNGWFNNIAPQPAGNNEVVFVAPYNSTGSLFACSVSVLGNIVVTFNPGHTLYCVNSLFVQNSNIGENARLIFENGASLVQTNPFAVNTGSIEYRRNTNLETTYDFTYFCSPVRDQMLLTIDRIVENMDAINGNLSGTGTAVTAPLGSNPYQTTFFDKYFDWINEGVPNRPTTQFTFNSMGQQTNWHWNVASTTNMNPAGKGFNIRAPKSFQEAAGPLPYLTNFIGVPNNGDVSIAVQGQPYPIANDLNNSSGSCAYPLFTDKTTNLIGNPYPSAIDADSFLMTNFDLIDYPLRFWSHNTQVSSLNPGGVNGQIFAYNNDDFALYTLLGGIATQRYFNLGPASAVVNTNRPTGKITACQGFFAHTIANGNINFDNTMRDGAGNNKSGQGGSFYRTAAPAMIGSLEKNRIWLSIEEVDPQSTILKYREILVGYMPNSQATNAYDKNFDAYKFTNAPQFNLYSLTNSNNNCYPLAIQARAQGTTFDVNDVIPLGYRCNAGTFIIRAATVDGIFGGSTPAQKFWLREKITVSGIITFNYYDLKTTPFNLNLTISMTADNTDQFAIVFSKPIGGLLQPWVCNSTLVALNSQITGNGSVNGTFIWKIRNLLTNVAVTCITNSVNSPAPQSSNNFFLTRLTTYDSLTNYSPNFVTFNTQYAISVGPITSSGYVFGPECVFTTPARRIFTGVNSTINTCGTIINNNTNINCLGNSTNLSRYHWRITRVDGSVRDVYTNTNVLQFGNTSNNFVTFPTAPLPPATVFSGFLLPNTDYSFEVEETQGFVPNNPSLFGPACIFKTSGTMPVFRSGNVISINPNPIINNFTIKSSEWLSDKINVSVTDMMGNVIDKFEANPTEIENKAIGDKYPSGIYNVNIKQNDNVNNIRIIKK